MPPFLRSRPSRPRAWRFALALAIAALGVLAPLLAPTDARAQGWSEFRTNGPHSASRYNVRLIYPSTWTSEAVDGPGQVRKFASPATPSGLRALAILSATDLDEQLPAEVQETLSSADIADSVFDLANLRLIALGQGIELDSHRTLVVGESPAAWFSGRVSEKATAGKLAARAMVYVVLLRDKMLLLRCAVFGPTKARERVDDLFTSLVPLFHRMGDSIRPLDGVDSHAVRTDVDAGTALQGPMWFSPDKRFGAAFPIEPKLIEVGGVGGGGVGYQSVSATPTGLLQCTISVLAPDALASAPSADAAKALLLEGARQMTIAVGASPDDLRYSWGKFGGKRPMLNHTFAYTREGLRLERTGFSISVGREIVAVSATYLAEQAAQQRALASRFLESFVIIDSSGAGSLTR